MPESARSASFLATLARRASALTRRGARGTAGAEAPRHLAVVVGPHAVTLIAPGDGRTLAARELAHEPVRVPAGAMASAGLTATNAGESLAVALDRALSGCAVRGAAARVLVADSLVRTWRVDPPANAGRLRECEAAALMRFQALYDEPPQDWLVRCDVDLERPFLACALARGLVTACARTLAAHGVRLSACEPEFVALWNHWSGQVPAGAWFGLCQPDALLVCMVEGGRLTGMRRLVRPGATHVLAADPDWLPASIEREAQRFGLSAPSMLAVAGTPPAAWLDLKGPGLTCHLLGAACDAAGLAGLPVPVGPAGPAVPAGSAVSAIAAVTAAPAVPVVPVVHLVPAAPLADGAAKPAVRRAARRAAA